MGYYTGEVVGKENLMEVYFDHATVSYNGNKKIITVQQNGKISKYAAADVPFSVFAAVCNIVGNKLNDDIDNLFNLPSNGN